MSIDIRTPNVQRMYTFLTIFVNIPCYDGKKTEKSHFFWVSKSDLPHVSARINRVYPYPTFVFKKGHLYPI